MPNIHQELLIRASAEKIYNAITTREGLSAWWTPHATATPTLNSISRFPFGPEYFKEMKIIQLKPANQVKWLCMAGATEWIGTTLSFELQLGNNETLLNTHPELKGTIELAGNDKQTLLIFYHDDWKEYTSMFAECSYTWGQFLRSLKLLCETGKGRTWPIQHRTEP